MRRQLVLWSLALAAVVMGAAWAQEHNESGPASRKPDEAKVKKEIAEFFKKEEAAHKSADFDATLAQMDFPITMVTDDSAGTVVVKEYSREQYVAMAKPLFEKMPKDIKVDTRPNYTVLSDSLVSVNVETSMKTPKGKLQTKSASILVKKNGAWWWKTMCQAGWGDAAK